MTENDFHQVLRLGTTIPIIDEDGDIQLIAIPGDFERRPMSIHLRYDVNGDPFLFNRFDLGIYEERPTGHRNAVTGEPITARSPRPGTSKFTGGLSADGSPTLAMQPRPEILPGDIPVELKWPKALGPDPR